MSTVGLDNIHYRVDVSMCALYGFSDGKKHIPGKKWYVSAHTLFDFAKAKGIIPEVLVDEDYYFQRTQMAPYRLAFHIIDRWGTIEDFYNHLASAYAFSPGRLSVRDLLLGRLWQIRDVRFWVIDKMCRLAGMPIAFLYTPYRKKGVSNVYSALVDMLAVLDECDAATLAGFARLLHAGSVNIRDVERLLDWRDAHRGIGKQQPQPSE